SARLFRIRSALAPPLWLRCSRPAYSRRRAEQMKFASKLLSSPVADGGGGPRSGGGGERASCPLRPSRLRQGFDGPSTHASLPKLKRRRVWAPPPRCALGRNRRVESAP